MNIIICEDESCYIDAMTASIQRWKKESKRQDIVVNVFTSTEDLLDAWEKGLHIDFLLLDIQIPSEMSGLELATHIRKKDSQMIIVFVTNYAEYATEGYNVNALRYLRKPVSDSLMFDCLNIAYQQWKLRQSENLVLAIKGQRHVMKFDDIMYIESIAHYLRIHKTDNEVLEFRNRLADMLCLLPTDLFVQCHKSYAVSLLYIRKLTRTEITMSNDMKISIGNKYLETCHNAFDTLYQGMIS